MKRIRLSSALILVLAFFPSSLMAEAAWKNADPARFCGTNAFQVSLTFTGPSAPIRLHAYSSLSRTNDLQPLPLPLLAQSNEPEGNKSQDTTPAEEEHIPDEYENGSPQIFDPLAPVNRAVYHFNDKLYFWVLKPVTQGYSYVVPELLRVGFSNAYDNLRSPVRFLNNLLQLRPKRSGYELVKFLFNSVVGVGGFADVSKSLLGIEKQEADFGQTLGRYGLGHGLYLVFPILGPSFARDGIGLAGDAFMTPMTYVNYFYFDTWEPILLFSHEKVNDTSFKIGDYESFKQAAIDPYVSMRDAFVQYRQKRVEETKQ